ncbi:MAG: hypothetical protein RRY55_00375 [Bacteroidales bacterium]
MKGKETKKESKKEKSSTPSIKGQSDYQKDKGCKSVPSLVVNKPKK